MKHLKRFNEELKPQTYRSAARKLAKKGMQKRASALSEWGDKAEKREEMVLWKENINIAKQFGTFKIQISDEDGKVLITDDFYIEISFDGLGFADNYENEKQNAKDKENFKVSPSFPFMYSIIPTSEEQINKLEEILPAAEFGNGSYWAGFLGFDIEIVDGKVEFGKSYHDAYDSNLTGICKFADRRSAMKIRNLLKSIIMGETSPYPSGMTHITDIHEYLESVILMEVGMSGDYGFELKDLAEHINKTHVSDFPGYIE